MFVKHGVNQHPRLAKFPHSNESCVCSSQGLATADLSVGARVLNVGDVAGSPAKQGDPIAS